MCRGIEVLPSLYNTVQCFCPPAHGPRKGLGHFLETFCGPLNDLEIETSMVPSTLAPPCCVPAPSQAQQRPLLGSSKPQATQGQSSQSESLLAPRKIICPRGKHSRGSVQSINPSLLCYKRPYCRSTNHSEMACTMSNHLLAIGHTLGTGPKLDTLCNLFTGGRQGRT